MLLFGYDVIYLLGSLILALGLLIILFILFSVVAVYFFVQKNRLFFPRWALIFLIIFELPVKLISRKFGIEKKQIDLMIVQITNNFMKEAYTATPYKDRAVFLPHCLRWEKCPAPLTAEGIDCKMCGKCPVSDVVKVGKELGTRVFVCPGSTVVKRMIKKYRPKAILGIGCHKETKEGAEIVIFFNLPAQAVVLQRDGCVNTLVDKEEVIEQMRALKN